MLRNSIKNSWTDVFELKKENKKEDFNSVKKDYSFNGW